MNVPKCPSCQSNVGDLDGQYAVCRSCSEVKRSVFQFCRACQREWARHSDHRFLHTAQLCTPCCTPQQYRNHRPTQLSERMSILQGLSRVQSPAYTQWKRLSQHHLPSL